MKPRDVIDIQQLMALYGHVVDEKLWGRTNEVFTAAAIYDVSDVGRGVLVGVDAIAAFWADPATPHPLAHHVSTVHVERGEDDVVRVWSKVAAVSSDGRVRSFSYRDIVERSDDGRWRMAERIVTLRRAPAAPPA